MRLTLESSANLRSCRAVESLTVINDPGLHDLYAEWIDRKVREHAVQ
jgi:hypothetical protein